MNQQKRVVSSLTYMPFDLESCKLEDVTLTLFDPDEKMHEFSVLENSEFVTVSFVSSATRIPI